MEEEFYFTDSPNIPIDLGEKEIELSEGELTLNALAKITIIFLPRPRLQFQIDITESTAPDYFEFMGKDVVSLKIISMGVETQVFLSSTNYDFNGMEATILATSVREPVVFGSLVKKISKLNFHILNFYDFLSETKSINTDTGGFIIGNSVIHVDNWQINIKTIDRGIFEKLKKTGGYAITHLGWIEKKNNGYFTFEEIEELFNCLHFFLSFSRGFNVATFLPIGLNEKNERIGGQWGVPKSESFPYSFVPSWFDEMGVKISDLFPLFWKKWSSSRWNETFRLAISWYLQSNKEGGAKEAGIIMTQTALELLAWVFIEEDKKLLSKEGFKKLPASDRIRLLMRSLNIPIEIPPQLKNLIDIGKENNWDGPLAFTEIRNGIVHPYHKQKEKHSKGIFEAWNLGQWYFEIIILALIEYQGNYANRLKLSRWKGEVEPVPYVAA